MTVVRAAAAQIRAPPNTAQAIERVEEFAALGANRGVQLLVFPESLLGGYSRGLLRCGDRRPERVGPGRAEYLAYSPEAVTIPGPQIDQLATIAAARGRRSDPGIRNHALLRVCDHRRCRSRRR